MSEPEPLTRNDWAVIYRLVDEYTERVRRDAGLPSDHPSHAYREKLREKVAYQRMMALRGHGKAENGVPQRGGEERDA